MLISNENNFEELCKKYEKHNIHWLTDDLVWKKSYGSLFKLRQFIDMSKWSTVNYTKITDITDNVVIIAAEPGMGKSTVLTYLAEKTKESDPYLWIVRINLNDYIKDLREANFDDIDGAFDFLLNIGNLKTSLEKELFKRSLHHKGNIALLFDGFDEISPDYKEKVIQLLQILKGTKAKLWISTRPHMQTELEDELSVFSYILKPFSQEDQEKFLKKFWGKEFSEKNEKRLETYIAKLLNLVSSSIRDKEREFASVPLQTKMLAEAFQEKLKKFYYSNQEKPELPKKLGLLDLYQHFVEKKYQIFYNEKMKTNIGNQAASSTFQSFKKSMEKKHKYLACNMLFPEQTNWFKETRVSDENLVRVGIITKIVDKSNFIHRTFVEYFAALWFADDNNLKKQEVKDFLREMIFKEENEVMRNFFDRMLADKGEIHIAVLNNDKEKIRNLLERNKSIINNNDKAGRTGLHLAAAYGFEEIVKILLDKLEKDSELETSINVKEKSFNWSPISYTDKNSYWNVTDLLLEKGANGDDMFDAIKNVRNPDEEGKTLLHIAAEKGYVNFARVLIKKGANKNNKTIHWWTKTVNFVRVLRGKGYVNSRDKYENTALHYAAENGNLNVVEYLVGKGADVNAKNKVNWTPLYLATRNGKLDVVKFLEGKGACVKTNEDDKTLLHSAAEIEDWDLVEYLVGKGADVNAKNRDNWTPLHLVAYYGKWDVVEYLVGKGADVNAKNKDDCTPLHLAAQYKKWDVVEYLVGKGADVNAKDKYKRTPLHRAAESGSLDVVEYLVGKGAEVSAKDKDDSTSLHWAAYWGKCDVVEYLVGKGADVNAKDKNDLTPLHLTAYYGKCDVVEYLVGKGADVNAKDKNDLTPLHSAAESGKLDVVEYLVGTGADVNAKNKVNRTPLYLATRNGNLNVVKFLEGKALILMLTNIMRLHCTLLLK